MQGDLNIDKLSKMPFPGSSASRSIQHNLCCGTAFSPIWSNLLLVRTNLIFSNEFKQLRSFQTIISRRKNASPNLNFSNEFKQLRALQHCWGHWGGQNGNFPGGRQAWCTLCTLRNIKHKVKIHDTKFKIQDSLDVILAPNLKLPCNRPRNSQISELWN